jgi:hypothetical protein
MFMIQQQEATKMDNALTVQIQFPDGRTACRSQSNQVKLVRTPGKMLVPVILSWMKERNPAARGGIKGMGFIVFGTVTSLTGQGQILFSALTTLTFRHDMFDRVRPWIGIIQRLKSDY